jgi:hypothetical protein
MSTRSPQPGPLPPGLRLEVIAALALSLPGFGALSRAADAQAPQQLPSIVVTDIYKGDPLFEPGTGRAVYAGVRYKW